MSILASSVASRPQRPEVGPQVPYYLVGHNIGHNCSDPTIHFEEDDVPREAGLEWTLHHLERFDEPGRYMILASTAWHFGLPFEVVMGGML